MDRQTDGRKRGGAGRRRSPAVPGPLLRRRGWRASSGCPGAAPPPPAPALRRPRAPPRPPRHRPGSDPGPPRAPLRCRQRRPPAPRQVRRPRPPRRLRAASGSAGPGPAACAEHGGLGSRGSRGSGGRLLRRARLPAGAGGATGPWYSVRGGGASSTPAVRGVRGAPHEQRRLRCAKWRGQTGKPGPRGGQERIGQAGLPAPAARQGRGFSVFPRVRNT